MIDDPNSMPLGAVLADLGPAAKLVAGDASQQSRQVRGAVVLLKPEDLPTDLDVVVICPGEESFKDLVAGRLDGPGRVIFVTAEESSLSEGIKAVGEQHIVIAVDPALNVATVVMSFSR